MVLLHSLIAGLGFAAAASCAALVEARAACNADNCLRALRATQISGRLEQASSACNSFWVNTVTPSITTITETATYSTTIISVVLTTDTNTAHETVTSTVFEDATTQGDPTSTQTIFTPAPLPGKKKRSVSGAFPAWASACSGAVRFTSACSCIGVTTAITVTAPAPSTTITVTETASFSATTTLTETDSLTLTATETQTSTTSTKTVGSVATAYATQFKLRVRWTQTGLLRYAKLVTSNGVDYVVPVDDFSSATIFSVSSEGILFSVQDGSYKLVYAATPGPGSNGIPLRMGTSVPSGYTRLYCSIAESDSNVTCGIGSVDTFNRWSANSSSLSLYRSDLATYNSVAAVPP
ncbi:hypothetical protein TWF281_004921 [Arthrobotrys megalospora]